MATLKVIEKGLKRDTRALEDRSPSENLRIDVNDWLADVHGVMLLPHTRASLRSQFDYGPDGQRGGKGHQHPHGQCGDIACLHGLYGERC